MRKRTLSIMAAAAVAAVPAHAARVEIILDVSGSMRAAMSGETRMEAARKAIRATLAGIQSDSIVALRLYGHRVSQDDKAGSCKDTELVVPFNPVDKPAFQAIVDRATPRGQTPLTHSLEQAARDFGAANSDEERVIILVSDGEESCGGDPAAAARRLRAEGFNVKVHTIGIDVDAAAREQLQAISTATGGEYHDARSAAALADSLTRLAQKGLVIDKKEEGLGQAIRGGDGYESAVEIKPGQLYRLDHHQRQNEYDYFHVSVKGGEKITAFIETGQKGVTITGDSFSEDANPYAAITLQANSRAKLGEALIIGSKGEKKGLQGTLSPSERGRLYVLVGNSYSAQHKDSRFQVDLVQQAGDAGSSQDAGGDESGAIAVAPGLHKGHLDGAGDDVDFFRFKADAEATYRVRVRATNDQVWMGLSVASGDGGVSQEKLGTAGDPLVVDDLRFPRGGDVFVRVAYNKHYGVKPATEYGVEIVQSGGTPAAAAPSGTAEGSGGGVRAFFRKLVSVVLWTGIFLAVFLAGGIGGFILGRRRR